MSNSNDSHEKVIGSRLIKDMSNDERPREKAIRYGIKSLTDSELMAIIFSTGLKGKSVIELSRDILSDNDYHLSKVARLSVAEMLKRYKGIGPAKAVTLLAALELGSRSAADAAKIDNPTITSSEVSYTLMRHHFERLDHEQFWVLLLSQAGKPIREIKIGQGGISATAVDVRLVMKAALEHLASAIILFHNHPSGNLMPSSQDDALTKKIQDASRLFDIRVNDHIIITDGDYYSYNDNGRLC